MKNLVILVIILVLSLTLFFLFKGDSPEQIDSTKFELAITQYLKKSNFGMSITEVKTLKIDDNKATSSCKLKDSNGLYNMGVIWEFKFIKENDKWIVVSHK